MGPPAPSRELLPGAGVLCFPGSHLLILVPKAWRWTPVVSSLRTMPHKKNSLHKEAGQHRGQTAGLEARQSSCGILTQALTSHVTSAKGCHLPHIPSLPLKNEGRKAAPTQTVAKRRCVEDAREPCPPLGLPTANCLPLYHASASRRPS